jgi:hypothetical protein
VFLFLVVGVLFVDPSTTGEGYYVSYRWPGWLEVKGIVVVVCVIVRDEGCEVGVLVYVEDGDRFK